MFSRWITDWASDPDGGGAEWRTQTRDAILSHDPTCSSLSQVWLPRKNGVTCPSDLFWCEDCSISFFNEVTYGWVGVGYDGGFPDGYFCECCWRKRREEDD